MDVRGEVKKRFFDKDEKMRRRIRDIEQKKLEMNMLQDEIAYVRTQREFYEEKKMLKDMKRQNNPITKFFGGVSSLYSKEVNRRRKK